MPTKSSWRRDNYDKLEISRNNKRVTAKTARESLEMEEGV